ncbi:hypothetical protein K7X08_002766 [Anisodus acutangulus]|uniref:Uncharacterized protein n=1 Tax=Anisodus acutangulus TaxID=402998 RepID=A0A9Q1MCJ4_9SOLA|nr:hypothetical protein K7X08_002766 [Anisodus acutangulus]
MNLARDSDVNVVLARISPGSSEAEVLQLLLSAPACDSIQITYNFVDRVLYRFKDDWKSVLGAFKWAQSRPNYKPSPELFDKAFSKDEIVVVFLIPPVRSLPLHHSMCHLFSFFKKVVVDVHLELCTYFC